MRKRKVAMIRYGESSGPSEWSPRELLFNRKPTFKVHQESLVYISNGKDWIEAHSVNGKNTCRTSLKSAKELRKFAPAIKFEKDINYGG